MCKGELDKEIANRVLSWGADLVKYYRALEPGLACHVFVFAFLLAFGVPCICVPFDFC